MTGPDFAVLPGSAALRERFGLIPRISRARDWRLYTPDGRRIVDLWQYGGRAVLGHKPAGLVRELKNAAERGLFAPFPSRFEGRFLQALAALFPGRVFRVYPDRAALEHDAARAGDAFPAPETWRPFADAVLPEIFTPVLPVPLAGAPAALVMEPAAAARFFPAAAAFPAGPLSPAVLAPAARAVYDLVSSPARSLSAFPKIRRALERDGAGDYWKNRGIWLERRVPPAEAEWTALFSRALAAGFLLPPERDAPAILPGTLSPGEEAKLAALLSSG